MVQSQGIHRSSLRLVIEPHRNSQALIRLERAEADGRLTLPDASDETAV